MISSSILGAGGTTVLGGSIARAYRRVLPIVAVVLEAVDGRTNDVVDRTDWKAEAVLTQEIVKSVAAEENFMVIVVCIDDDDRFFITIQTGQDNIRGLSNDIVSGAAIGTGHDERVHRHLVECRCQNIVDGNVDAKQEELNPRLLNRFDYRRDPRVIRNRGGCNDDNNIVNNKQLQQVPRSRRLRNYDRTSFFTKTCTVSLHGITRYVLQTRKSRT